MSNWKGTARDAVLTLAMVMSTAASQSHGPAKGYLRLCLQVPRSAAPAFAALFRRQRERNEDIPLLVPGEAEGRRHYPHDGVALLVELDGLA